MKYRGYSQKKRNKSVDFILIALPPVLLLLLWEILGRMDLLNRSILPTLESVIGCAVNLAAKGTLWKHIVASAVRIVKGFAIGTLAGLVLGVAMGLFPVMDRLCTAMVGIFKPIPIIALIPFFILWFGIGEESKIAVIILGVFWPVLINTMAGIKGVDGKLLEVAMIFRKGYGTTLFRIILPSAVPFIFNGIRLGAGNALMCVVTAEMIAASAGIGYMIMFARELSQPAVMIVGIAVIGAFGLVIDVLFLRLEKLLIQR